MSQSIEECRVPKETGQCNGAGPSELVCRHCEAPDCKDRYTELTYTEKLVNDCNAQNEMIDKALGL